MGVDVSARPEACGREAPTTRGSSCVRSSVPCAWGPGSFGQEVVPWARMDHRLDPLCWGSC